MVDSTLAFLLILFLCAVLCLRFFFQDGIARDSLSVLAPGNLVLCVLCFFAWGVSLSSLLVAFSALIVFFINAHSFFCFAARLKHGRFSGGFAAASLITLPLILAAGALLVYTRPVSSGGGVLRKIKMPSGTAEIQRENAVFTGSLGGGFFPRSGILEPLNGYITAFAPRDKDAGDMPLVLFVSDIRASVNDYEPFLMRLADEGYEVKAAEFFTRDNRRFGSFMDSRPVRKFAACFLASLDKELFDADTGLHAAIAAKEYEALIELYGKEAARSGRTVFLLADSDARIVQQAAGGFWQGVSVTVTPGPAPGVGCIEQTDPLFALCLGFQRDPLCESPKNAVKVFTEALGKR
ncbi:MAG: hypothetical protein Pg6C_15810 [Treponemataceae bacterium]|nr:MAG: hypothetical protein Pg6C_15810 [Treponemataceae bacterium]